MENIELFLAQNPWQVQKKFTVEPFIEREVFHQTLGWLGKDEIITLTGPRQAGKTTILLKLVEYLLSEYDCPGRGVRRGIGKTPKTSRFYQKPHPTPKILPLS